MNAGGVKLHGAAVDYDRPIFGDYVRLAADGAFVTGPFNNRTVNHLFAGAGPGVRYDGHVADLRARAVRIPPRRRQEPPDGQREGIRRPLRRRHRLPARRRPQLPGGHRLRRQRPPDGRHVLQVLAENAPQRAITTGGAADGAAPPSPETALRRGAKVQMARKAQLVTRKGRFTKEGRSFHLPNFFLGLGQQTQISSTSEGIIPNIHRVSIFRRSKNAPRWCRLHLPKSFQKSGAFSCSTPCSTRRKSSRRSQGRRAAGLERAAARRTRARRPASKATPPHADHAAHRCT